MTENIYLSTYYIAKKKWKRNLLKENNLKKIIPSIYKEQKRGENAGYWWKKFEKILKQQQ